MSGPAEILAREARVAARDRLEAEMLQQLRAAKLLDGLVRQHVFHPTRRWRFDFAWPRYMLALEVDGGVYSGGRHVRGRGFEGDIEKLNEALLLGWRVLRASGGQVRSGQALAWVQKAMETGR